MIVHSGIIAEYQHPLMVENAYKEIYYDAIGGVNGAVSTGSFNPGGTVYTHVKIEIWNGTVYDCAGCAVVYRE